MREKEPKTPETATLDFESKYDIVILGNLLFLDGCISYFRFYVDSKLTPELECQKVAGGAQRTHSPEGGGCTWPRIIGGVPKMGSSLNLGNCHVIMQVGGKIRI